MIKVNDKTISPNSISHHILHNDIYEDITRDKIESGYTDNRLNYIRTTDGFHSLVYSVVNNLWVGIKVVVEDIFVYTSPDITIWTLKHTITREAYEDDWNVTLGLTYPSDVETVVIMSIGVFDSILVSSTDAFVTITSNVHEKYSPGNSNTIDISGISINMVWINPINSTYPSGFYDTKVGTITSNFKVLDTPVTWELWETIFNWAITKGYAFKNIGQKGSDPGTSTNSHPVVNIAWEDTIVWCNALTDYYNITYGTSIPIVYKSNGVNIKNSFLAYMFEDIEIVSGHGARLLTRAEWEYIARYKGRDDTYTTYINNGLFFTKGDTASGAIGGVDNELNNISDYAVFNVESTAAVKSKYPNVLNIYDLSGNVSEWCYDMLGSKRVALGGNWHDNIEGIQIGGLSGASNDSNIDGGFSYEMGSNIGFRICMGLDVSTIVRNLPSLSYTSHNITYSSHISDIRWIDNKAVIVVSDSTGADRYNIYVSSDTILWNNVYNTSLPAYDIVGLDNIIFLNGKKLTPQQTIVNSPTMVGSTIKYSPGMGQIYSINNQLSPNKFHVYSYNWPTTSTYKSYTPPNYNNIIDILIDEDELYAISVCSNGNQVDILIGYNFKNWDVVYSIPSLIDPKVYRDSTYTIVYNSDVSYIFTNNIEE